MAKCINIQRKKRSVCIGDMDELILLHNRAIQGINSDTDVDFTEQFTPLDSLAVNTNINYEFQNGDNYAFQNGDNFEFSGQDFTFAMVETVSGVTLFDSTGTERDISHNFYIYYDATVTAETWVEFESRKFDIARVEDFEERHEYMKLMCYERGPNTKQVNYA